MLERVVGLKELVRIDKLNVREPLMLTVGTAITLGITTRVSKDELEIVLKRPVVAWSGARVAISKQVHGRWRLVGWGVIKD